MWASAFAVITFALLAFSPGELTLLRFLFASAAFGVIVALHRPPSLSCKDIPFIALLGLFGITFYRLVLNYGEQRVTAGATSFLLYFFCARAHCSASNSDVAGETFFDYLVRHHTWHFGSSNYDGRYWFRTPRFYDTFFV
jgi:hypothetical protein